jgi:DnaJ family protein C protein 8
MSILVHPDKNLDDKERAEKSFEAVKKSWKTLENEEGYKKCKEVVTEAKERVEESVSAGCGKNAPTFHACSNR